MVFFRNTVVLEQAEVVVTGAGGRIRLHDQGVRVFRRHAALIRLHRHRHTGLDIHREPLQRAFGDEAIARCLFAGEEVVVFAADETHLTLAVVVVTDTRRTDRRAQERIAEEIFFGAGVGKLPVGILVVQRTQRRLALLVRLIRGGIEVRHEL